MMSLMAQASSFFPTVPTTTELSLWDLLTVTGGIFILGVVIIKVKCGTMWLRERELWSTILTSILTQENG
jgi:hypothetical protein